jgi:hypothetical protein
MTTPMPLPAGLLDCQTCGACCASPWQGHGYVALSPEDVLRVRAAGAVTVTLRQGSAEEAGELVEKLATRPDSVGRFVCAELNGAPGGACACRIYESRPRACRQLEPGSPGCFEARQRLGLVCPTSGERQD